MFSDETDCPPICRQEICSAYHFTRHPRKADGIHTTTARFCHSGKSDYETEIGHSVSAEVCMQQPYNGQNLFSPSGSRKYLNATERSRFIEAARRAPTKICLFCLTLRWSGARISEVLALTPAAIDIEGGVAGIRTLKRRKRGIIRQVPLPLDLLNELGSGVRACDGAARSRAGRQTIMALQPHHGLAVRETGHDGSGHNRHTRDAQRFATRVRRECVSIKRAAAPRPALARPRLASNDFYIWRRSRRRGARLCRPHVAEPLSTTIPSGLTIVPVMFS